MKRVLFAAGMLMLLIQGGGVAEGAGTEGVKIVLV